MKIKSQTRRKLAKIIVIVSTILCFGGLAFVVTGSRTNGIIGGVLTLSGIAGLILSLVVMHPVEERQRRLRSRKQSIYFNMCIDACMVGDYDKVTEIHSNFLKRYDNRVYIRAMYQAFRYKEALAQDSIDLPDRKSNILKDKYEIK